MSERITVVVPADLKDDIEKMKERLHLDTSSFIRHLLYDAIKEEKIAHAIDEYNRGKVSFGKASEMAGVSMWEFIDEARKRHVQVRISVEDAEKEIAAISAGKLDGFLPRGDLAAEKRTGQN